MWDEGAIAEDLGDAAQGYACKGQLLIRGAVFASEQDFRAWQLAQQLERLGIADLQLRCAGGVTVPASRSMLALASPRVLAPMVKECKLSADGVLNVQEDSSLGWSCLMSLILPIARPLAEMDWASASVVLPIAHKYAMHALLRVCVKVMCTFVAGSQDIDVVLTALRLGHELSLPSLQHAAQRAVRSLPAHTLKRFVDTCRDPEGLPPFVLVELLKASLETVPVFHF